MVNNIDKEIGSKYSEEKIKRMKEIWPDSLKKAFNIMNIGLDPKIINALSGANISSSNNNVKPKKKTNTKGMSKC